MTNPSTPITFAPKEAFEAAVDAYLTEHLTIDSSPSYPMYGSKNGDTIRLLLKDAVISTVFLEIKSY